MMHSDLALIFLEGKYILKSRLLSPLLSLLDVLHFLILLGVAHDLPSPVRRDNSEGGPGTAVWLVEAGEPPVAEVGLQVRVEVQVLVRGVLESVEARRVVHVRVLELERYHILRVWLE